MLSQVFRTSKYFIKQLRNMQSVPKRSKHTLLETFQELEYSEGHPDLRRTMPDVYVRNTIVPIGNYSKVHGNVHNKSYKLTVIPYPFTSEYQIFGEKHRWAEFRRKFIYGTY